jgi:hypothetical protein
MLLPHEKDDLIEYLSGWCIFIIVATLITLSIRYGIWTSYYALLPL